MTAHQVSSASLFGMQGFGCLVNTMGPFGLIIFIYYLVLNRTAIWSFLHRSLKLQVSQAGNEVGLKKLHSEFQSTFRFHSDVLSRLWLLSPSVDSCIFTTLTCF